ncbi:MAG: Rieske 2Fe-2S domain-containing protein [Burkholderiales bacterium]
MLTREENDLLTRTGPGTRMGDLMRRYWIPALLTDELPAPDSPPKRLTLLGEKLVAFRDTKGRVGLFDERCPHRNASMFFGRNEEEGVRCVYHGWKFDVSGQCVDMPSEPAESNFKRKVQITAYPCIERGGVIWTYMGLPELKPAFPDLEWTEVPAANRYTTRRLQESNWLQGYEGGWDTAHLPILHLGDTQNSNFFSGKGKEALRGIPALYEFIPTEFGFVYGRGRKNPEGGLNWECALMFMPSWKMFQPFAGADNRITLLAWVPVDDENCTLWGVEYHPRRALTEEEMTWSKTYHYIHVELEPGSERPVRNRDNDYLVDRAKQKSGSFTGVLGLGLQDSAIQESMGTICDRTREHLSPADVVLVKLRRHLLRVLDDMQSGAALPGMDAQSHLLRPGIIPLPEGQALESKLRESLGIATPVLAK